MDYRKLGNCVVYTSRVGHGKTLGCITQLVNMSRWKNPPEIVSNQLITITHEPFDVTRLLDYQNKLIYLDASSMVFGYMMLTVLSNKQLAYLIHRITKRPNPELEESLPSNREVYSTIFRNGNRLLLNVPTIDLLDLNLRYYITDHVKTVVYRRLGKVMLRRCHAKYHPTPEEVRKGEHLPRMDNAIEGNRYFRYYKEFQFMPIGI